MINIDGAARAIFLGLYDFVTQAADTVHIYVKATPAFLEDNPVMTDSVHRPEGSEVGHCILNISPSAVRELTVQDRILTFNARFTGVEHRLKVYLGDIVGMGEAGSGLIFDCTMVPLTLPEGGTVACRPLGSGEEQPAPEPPTKASRPALSVVK